MAEKKQGGEPFDPRVEIGQTVEEILFGEMLEQTDQQKKAEPDSEKPQENKRKKQKQNLPQAPKQEASVVAAKTPRTGGMMPVMPRRKKKKRLTKWIKIIIGVLIAAGLAFLVRSCLLQSRQAAKTDYETVEAARRDLTVELSGTGSIAAAEEAVVIPALAGEVQEVACQEGDVVQKDDVLVSLDRTDAEYAVNRAQLALDNAKDTYNQLVDSQKDITIVSTASGVIDTLSIGKGDSVTAGAVVATVSDHSNMFLKIPFSSEDCARISVGSAAVITLNDTLETITGTVDSISAADIPGVDGSMVREVIIRVANPGNLSPSAYATAAIGDIACSGSGTFTYQTQQKAVLSNGSGEVSKLMVKEGSAIQAGDAIAVLSVPNIDSQIRSAKRAIEDAQLTLENAQKQLEHFTIKAPISGTVVEKKCEVGDILAVGTPIFTIYDLSYLTFDVQVDELDIPMIEVGQQVEITADALPNEMFHGVVEKIGMVGSAAAGVTTYPVTVRIIGENTGLMHGMNVDADISIGTYEQVLTVPVDAVTRGNTVLVSKDSPSAKAAKEDAKEELEGFVRIPIQIGAANEDYIIVTDGLQEGDVLAVVNQEGSSLFDMMMTSGSSRDSGNSDSGSSGTE